MFSKRAAMSAWCSIAGACVITCTSLLLLALWLCWIIPRCNSWPITTIWRRWCQYSWQIKSSPTKSLKLVLLTHRRSPLCLQFSF